MNKPQDPEAAETVQTTSVPAVDLPHLVRQIVSPDIIEGNEWVTCPRCKREDLKSGGWPGIPFGEDWKATCECGQPLLIISLPNIQADRPQGSV